MTFQTLAMDMKVTVAGAEVDVTNMDTVTENVTAMVTTEAK